MPATFYGVLGVGPDADDEEIRRAFRERVKEYHPDVSSDPDAESAFKRITTAKETLLDDAERARYDSLGHAAYVREHVDCSAWTETVGTPSAGDQSGSAASASGTADKTATGGSTGATRSTKSPSEKTGSPGATTARSATGGGPASGSAVGDTARAARSVAGGSAAGTTRADGRNDRAARGHRSRSRRDRAERRRRSAAATYASGNFWQAHEPGSTAVGRARPSLLGRLFDGLRALGPWLFVHVLLLGLAFGTAGFVYLVVLGGGPVSLPALALLVGEVAVAVLLTATHTVSLIYR